jgi:hypothetical protein
LQLFYVAVLVGKIWFPKSHRLRQFWKKRSSKTVAASVKGKIYNYRQRGDPTSTNIQLACSSYFVSCERSWRSRDLFLFGRGGERATVQIMLTTTIFSTGAVSSQSRDVRLLAWPYILAIFLNDYCRSSSITREIQRGIPSSTNEFTYNINFPSISFTRVPRDSRWISKASFP